MPDQIIKGVKEGFEEIGNEVKDQATEATVGVIKNIPQQISGGQNNNDGQKPVEPPSDKEVIEHLYGATGKPKLNKKQLNTKAQKKAIEDTKKRERIRQNLEAMMQSPMQKEPTVAERLEMEEQEKIAEEKKKREKELPVLQEPTAAPKKGIFGLFTPRGKKGRAVRDLQTSVEKRMPGSGIA